MKLHIFYYQPLLSKYPKWDSKSLWSFSVFLESRLNVAKFLTNFRLNARIKSKIWALKLLAKLLWFSKLWGSFIFIFIFHFCQSHTISFSGPWAVSLSNSEIRGPIPPSFEGHFFAPLIFVQINFQPFIFRNFFQSLIFLSQLKSTLSTHSIMTKFQTFLGTKNIWDFFRTLVEALSIIKW